MIYYLLFIILEVIPYIRIYYYDLLFLLLVSMQIELN